MHYLYRTPICLLLLLHTCQARRELSLFRVDDGEPPDAHAPERRAVHAAQAAMFGDASPAPKKTTESKQQDNRETYRSEEARLQKERREMFFRNLGVGFGGSRSGGNSMSMGASNDDPISSGLMSLSFSMDIVSEIEFGSLDDFGPSPAGSAGDLDSGDLGISTGVIQSSEESDGTPKVGAPVVSEPQMSTWQEVKEKLLGTRIDVQALRAKALAYAEKHKDSGIQQADTNLRSVEKPNMPWDDPDRPYDDLKSKALVLAAETKNKLATEHERVQVRRRMLADGS